MLIPALISMTLEMQTNNWPAATSSFTSLTRQRRGSMVVSAMELRGSMARVGAAFDHRRGYESTHCPGVVVFDNPGARVFNEPVPGFVNAAPSFPFRLLLSI